jgi:hypothetical protein
VDNYVEGTSFGTWLTKDRLTDRTNNKILSKKVQPPRTLGWGDRLGKDLSRRFVASRVAADALFFSH